MSSAPQQAATPPAPHSSFLRVNVLAACRHYGPMLKVPPGIVAWKMMAAIASNESSMGANCGPRHEPSYDVGGAVYERSQQQQALVAKYGAAAACSYGPWQTMFINCKGYTPDELLTDLDKCADAFVTQFNSYVIGVRRAQTLEEIGEVWNLGHIGPDQTYTDKLAAAYNALG